MRRARRAHPRSRGENKGEFKFKSEFEGSSPLTRGKRVWEVVHESAARLIPAHAGKTTSASTASSLARAHPRSRGENMVDASAM